MPDKTTPKKYRKGSFEARIDSLLPDWPQFDVIACGLIGTREGFELNDLFYLGRHCDRSEAIAHLWNRWHVFRVNYSPKARIYTIRDTNESGEAYPSYLQCEGLPFAEIRKSERVTLR